MRFTATAVLALATSVFAQTADFDPVTKPLANEVIPAGTTYEITWTAPPQYADETITISLIGGETQGTQVPLLDIASGVKNSDLQYSWSVDSSLGAEKFYGLVVKLESNPDVFQYSNPFQIKASSGGATTDTTVKVTHSSGIKTIHLSTTIVPTIITTSASSTVSTPSSTPTSTPACVTPTYVTPIISTVSCANSTSAMTFTSVTLVKPTTALPATTAIAVPPTTTSPTTVIPPVVTPGAAARVGAGSMAFVGLVVAALAL